MNIQNLHSNIYTSLLKSVAFFLLFSACHNEVSSQMGTEYLQPKTYIATKAKHTITIDGLANEIDWQNAKPTASFIDIEGVKIPKYDTKLKMLWDKTHLYFLAEMEDPHVWATLKERDTIIYYNNDFEIFIDPDGDGQNYYELEFNALNTLWDLFLTKPYREKTVVLNDWDAKGVQSAVHIDGTLNKSSDTDKKWTLEVAIPLEVFKASYYQENDLSGTFWRMNFSRVHWDFDLTDGRYSRKKKEDGTFATEYNWVWSPQGVIAMHQPETWGYVYFASDENGAAKNFQIPEDEHIKWKLFELYRAQKSFYDTNQRWSTSLKELNVDVSFSEIKLTPRLETHATGWNISIKSPFTNKTLIIRENGDLVSQ